MENKRQAIELSDILRDNYEHFTQSNRLCSEQKKAIEDIIKCRTSTLGGHIYRCDHCNYIKHAYNSCRNRNCPKCQFTKKVVWVDKLTANLLPVKHFHLIFTIPSCLHKLFYINQKVAYGLFFESVGKSLQQCASNPNYLGAQIGAIAILHTWGQTLTYHPHLHLMVPAGGLSEDQMEWIASKKKFFLPVKILSSIFRGVLCRLLEKANSTSNLTLPDDYVDFQQVKNLCYQKKWVVYCEKPFSNSENLIQYLGNYTHRVAISNNRIIDYQDDKVIFSYKDYKTAGIRKEIRLDVNEFIRRFAQHILPSGFYKIRYFGFMAMCNVKSKFEICIQLINKYMPISSLQGLSALEVWRNITGRDPYACPECHIGKLIQNILLPVESLQSG